MLRDAESKVGVVITKDNEEISPSIGGGDKIGTIQEDSVGEV